MLQILKENALYNGRIAPWKRPEPFTKEHLARKERIDREQDYFMEGMSREDRRRFMELEELYMQAGYEENKDAHAHGFALGALLMMEVLDRRAELFDWEP